ncbi:MAG: hypothetical protein RI944_412 [Actinomycetota bacterium]
MHIAEVVVIDDDIFVGSSLTAGFKSYGIKVSGTAKTYSQAIEICKNNSIEVAVVDLDLGPGPNGIDICFSLRNNYPNIGLVLLTSYRDPKIADPNLRSFPKGTRYVSKSNLSDFQILVNEVISAKINPLKKTFKLVGKSQLTHVQLEVLKMISEGLSTSEIARRRNVSEKAIEGTISTIQKVFKLEKNKTNNQRVQLARAYFKLSGKKPPGA